MGYPTDLSEVHQNVRSQMSDAWHGYSSFTKCLFMIEAVSVSRILTGPVMLSTVTPKIYGCDTICISFESSSRNSNSRWMTTTKSHFCSFKSKYVEYKNILEFSRIHCNDTQIESHLWILDVTFGNDNITVGYGNTGFDSIIWWFLRNRLCAMNVLHHRTIYLHYKLWSWIIIRSKKMFLIKCVQQLPSWEYRRNVSNMTEDFENGLPQRVCRGKN